MREYHVRFCVRLRGKFLGPTRLSQETKGAEASANLLTLIENAKHHNLNVFNYLQYVFEHIREAKAEADLQALLPGCVAKANILDKHNASNLQLSA